MSGELARPSVSIPRGTVQVSYIFMDFIYRNLPLLGSIHYSMCLHSHCFPNGSYFK